MSSPLTGAISQRLVLASTLAHAVAAATTLTIRPGAFVTLDKEKETNMQTNTNRVPSRQPVDLGDGIFEMSGEKYMRDAEGRIVPLALVKPAEKLEDEMVRKAFSFAIPLSAEVARFKGYTMAEILGFQELLAQEYGLVRGGKKGNVTLWTYDGRMRIELQVADRITFGPQIHAASELVDECLREWGETSPPQLRGLVEGVFNVGKAEDINQYALFKLLRYKIDDERWQRAMDALRDSIRVIGTQSYLRFYMRETLESEWVAVTISIAKVKSERNAA